MPYYPDTVDYLTELLDRIEDSLSTRMGVPIDDAYDALEEYANWKLQTHRG